MKSMMLSCAALLAATLPVFAASTSYVVLRDTDTDSLVRVSSDGKTVTTIANKAGGVGLAVEASGNYIVGAKSALLRVSRAGVVTKLADAPAGAEWASVTIDANGDIIVADGGLPVLWRVSADGQSIGKIATLNAITYPSGSRPAVVMVDISGNYLWLIEGIVDHRRGFETRFYRVTAAGDVTVIPLNGPRTYSPTSITSDGAGSYLFTDHDHRSGPSVWRLTPDGQVTKFASLPEYSSPAGLARNPETGEIVVAATFHSGLLRTSPDGSTVADLVDQPELRSLGSSARAVVAETSK